MCSVNGYDQEATVVEFGKLGVSLFFLFFSPLTCSTLRSWVPHTLLKTLY